MHLTTSLRLGAFALALASAGSAFAAPPARGVEYYIPPLSNGSVNPNPFLASGVSVGQAVATYMSAGTGPAARNTAAPGGTPERYIDTVQFPGGVLPAGMTITEAQGLNALERIKENLAANGLALEDVTFMRIYLEKPPGTTRADYDGWNRAYRKYFANVDLVTGDVIATYAPVYYANARRPARSNLEVATLPVLGWLVEIEVIAAYPPGRAPR